MRDSWCGKLGLWVVLSILFVALLGGCSLGGNSGNVESWELRPFYGETRFLIVDETGEPVPEAMLQVANLSIVELKDADSVHSDEAGLITVHQLERGTVYWGDGPPAPTFTFSAPGYEPQTYSVDDLVAGTSYDPYSAVDLPTTTFQNGEQTSELPLYEFTIHFMSNNQPLN